MLRLILFILFFINCHSWDPKLYPYNPKIHNFGNNGAMGHIHSLIAPGFTMYTEKILYNYNVREEILNKIGEPYIKSLKSKDEKKSGLGLGIFIGKTLLEKNNAKLLFRNSETRGGAEIKIEWSNKNLINI